MVKEKESRYPASVPHGVNFSGKEAPINPADFPVVSSENIELAFTHTAKEDEIRTIIADTALVTQIRFEHPVPVPEVSYPEDLVVTTKPFSHN